LSVLWMRRDDPLKASFVVFVVFVVQDLAQPAQR
jgi:hypothetical protein